MVSDEFLIGFIAGEGTFCFGINTADGKKYVSPVFGFRVHEKDVEVVEAMKEHVDVGGVNHVGDRGTVEWRVTSEDDLVRLRDYVEENAPEEWWITEKGKNFEVWSECLDIYADGKTRTDEAIEIAQKAKKLNPDNGISEERWDAFIESKKEETIHYCEEETTDGSPCERTVSSSDETCYRH